MAAPALPSFLRPSNKDNPQSIRQSTYSFPPFFSGSGALVRAFVRDHHLDQEEMEMKKIACAVLVAASATVALAADAPAAAPGPGAAAGSAAAAVPAVGAVLGATVLSFFAYYLQ